MLCLCVPVSVHTVIYNCYHCKNIFVISTNFFCSGNESHITNTKCVELTKFLSVLYKQINLVTTTTTAWYRSHECIVIFTNAVSQNY